MKLSVFVVTYNQEKYIRQCLDGILMQKVDFDYEVVISEDHGTDDTRTICEEYARYFPQVRLLPLIDNLGIARNWRRVLSECNGEYIAMCEGDDYWTDPQKLQKQVNFLEEHKEFTICFHDVKVWKQNENVMVNDWIMKDVGCVTEIYDLAKSNYIYTLSVVFRNKPNILQDFIKLDYDGIGNRLNDYPLWVICAQYGKIYKIKECMGVYRYGSGVWSANGTMVERSFIKVSMLSKLAFVINDTTARKLIEEQVEDVVNYNCNMMEKLQNDIAEIKRSKTYRLGALIAKPYTSIRTLIKKMHGK